MPEQSEHRRLLVPEETAISHDVTQSQRTASLMQMQVSKVEVMETNWVVFHGVAFN